MDLIYVICPALGVFFGFIYGNLINGRVIIGSADWVPTYIVLGALWGLGGAAAYRSMFKKEDPEKGEFLTGTKAYKKKIGNKKDKAQKSD